MARKCIECGARAIRSRRSVSIEYQGRSAKCRVTGDWCTSPECGESVLDGDALKTLARARATFKAEARKLITPAEIAAIREELGLSQRAAGKILGGGPIAFHKYESGKQLPSAPMSNLLRVLRRYPEDLALLENT